MNDTVDEGAKSPVERENPFDGQKARLNSSYCAVRDGELIMSDDTDPARSRANFEAFGMLQDFVVHRPYPCVGAQASFNQDACRLGTYGQLGDAEATAGLARDLFTFTREVADSEGALMSFLAVFDGPAGLTEEQFEERLWTQLAGLHVLDRRHFDWADSVSSDPNDSTFAFSFAEHGFYVVGMHPNSSRAARQFARPMLVFNPHSLFDRLRERGAYDKMQRVVRARDEALNGSINPMLKNFGEASEAPQYSGRAVDEDWSCPFHDAVAKSSNRN